jgi:hypothetical protein
MGRVTKEYGLGRLHAADPRDDRHRLSAVAAAVVVPDRQTFYWPTARAMYQRNYPRCVGYGWTAWRRAAPVMVRGIGDAYAIQLYEDAQRVDEWPGEDYAGTSVRGGAKVLERDGILKGGYRWSTSATEVKNFLLSRDGGTVVIGIDWTASMFDPDTRGFIEPTGADEGGHCLLAVGYSHVRNAFRLLNSWDVTWGQAGRCWIHYDAMQERLSRPWAEACVGFEQKPVLVA